MDEVHIFMAVAKASAGNELGYASGQKHALLIFVRQPYGSDHDWTRAEEIATNSGWSDVDISKAGSIESENVNGKDEIISASYEEALEAGSSIIAYSDPVE